MTLHFVTYRGQPIDGLSYRKLADAYETARELNFGLRRPAHRVVTVRV